MGHLQYNKVWVVLQIAKTAVLKKISVKKTLREESGF